MFCWNIFLSFLKEAYLLKKIVAVILVIILLPILVIAGYLFWLDFRWYFESDLANHFRNYSGESAPYVSIDISSQISNYEKTALLEQIQNAGFVCENTGAKMSCIRNVPDIVCSQRWFIDVTFGDDRVASKTEATIGTSCL